MNRDPYGFELALKRRRSLARELVVLLLYMLIGVVLGIMLVGCAARAAAPVVYVQWKDACPPAYRFLYREHNPEPSRRVCKLDGAR